LDAFVLFLKGVDIALGISERLLRKFMEVEIAIVYPLLQSNAL